MPAADPAALIVARFLKTNGYSESFEAFVKEAGLLDEDGDTRSGDLIIEQLIEEKRSFDKSMSFEKLTLADDDIGWHDPAPAINTRITALPSTVTVLNAVVDRSPEHTQQILFASTSDKAVRAISLPELTTLTSASTTEDAPTLAQVVVRSRYRMSTTMAGELIVSELIGGHVLYKRKDHAKFAIGLVAVEFGGRVLLVTAGWDKRLLLYHFEDDSETAETKLSEPITRLELPEKPEALIFVSRPQSGEPILVVTRTDSSHLYYYAVKNGLQLIGKQNLAPYSNAWVAFTPSSIAQCPANPGLIAVATNSTPHMKVLVVELLLPEELAAAEGPSTALEKARAEQAVADREYAAIKLHCNAMAPQTAFSTPLVVWRPSGQGVWVNSDDGVIRGIDTASGKVVAKLRGHDEGSKVRALWSGLIQTGEAEEEWLVSGGFDHNLFIWRAGA